MTRIRSIAAILSIALLLTMGSSTAQIQVFDPANYAQNLQTAANTLKQINNQLTALQNQTQMLLNQAKHLVSLPTSLVSAIDQTFAQTQNILRNVDRIAYDVQAIDTLIGDITPPAELMKTQTDRKIAEEERKTYEIQEAAQRQRQELVRATALANIQQQMVDADQGVRISDLQAQSAIKRANGEAESTKLRALGEAEAIRATGNAKAEAYRAGVESLGAGNYTVMQLTQTLAEKGVRIVPDVSMTGAQGGSGLLDSLLALVAREKTEQRAA